MEYKRLTIPKQKGVSFRYVALEKGTIADAYDLVIDEKCDKVEEILDRLAELEDKIENGTLIDTKVKRGQRVYMRGFWKGELDEYIVSNIGLDNGELEISLKHDFDEGKTCYSATIVEIEEIGKTVFLTKAEAEQRLKELKVEI